MILHLDYHRLALAEETGNQRSLNNQNLESKNQKQVDTV